MKYLFAAILFVLSFESFAGPAPSGFRRTPRRPVSRTAPAPQQSARDLSWGTAANTGLVYLGTGFGAESWYIIAKDMHVGLQYLTSSSELVSTNIDSSNIYESLEATTQIIQGYFRYLFWGSFGTTATLGTANIKGVWGYKDAADSSKDLLTSYKDTLLFSSASFGNHVQFDNGFSLGVDWFGAGFILSQKVQTSSPDSGLEDASSFLADKTPEQQIASRIKDNFKYYLFVFRFGYAF